MKQKSLLLILMSIILSFGCRKNEYFANPSEVQNLQINSDLKIQSIDENKSLRSIVSLKSEKSQRLSFTNFLTPGEKVNLLRIRFENLIIEMHMNKDQISYIQALNRYLVEDLFKESALRKEFLKNDTDLRKKAVRLFGEKEAIFLLTSLKTYDEFKNGNKTTNNTISTFSSAGSESGEQQKTCACNQSSDWCGERDGPCVSASCKSTPESGCGTLWAHPCNGWCKLLLSIL